MSPHIPPTSSPRGSDESGEAGRIRLHDIHALCQVCDAPEKLPGLLDLAKVAASHDGDGLWWYKPP